MSGGYGLSLVTAATSTAVTLAEARRQCGLPEDYAYHDALLSSLIRAATSYVERYTGRAIMSQTFDYSCQNFPYGDDPLYLPRSPLSSVTSVKYYDANETQQTWSSSNYIVFADREPGMVMLAATATWPVIGLRPMPVTVRFVAGYSSASAVPEDLRALLLLLIAHWFENRQGNIIGTSVSALPHSIDALLTAWRVGDEFHQYAMDED